MSSYSELVKEWHPTKNGKVTPKDITSGSGKKFWWLCPKGHCYESVIKSRTGNKSSGCPYCSGRKVNEENNLLALFPAIAKEWHPTKNGKVTPKDITSGSGKKFWWLCPKGHEHEWKTGVNRRTKCNTSCPFCSNKKLSSTNSLSARFPELAKEWHPTKNGKLKPSNLISGTKRRVWWKCPKGDEHEWEATCDSRTSKGTNCPFCSNKRPTSENNIVKIYPHLVKFLHPIKNGELHPTKIIAGTEKKIWWICPLNQNHEWKQQPYQLKGLDEPCPFCGLRKVCKDNNLDVLFPKIAKELHPEKNFSVSARKLLPNTSKKVWWKCKNNHEWLTTVLHRTSRGQNCPLCSNQSSIPEIRLYTELMSIFTDVENRKKIDGVEADLFIPTIATAIEYDGAYFHKSKELVDFKKNKFFQEKDIDLLRVRESPLKKLSDKDVLVSSDGIKKKDLNLLLSNLSHKVNLSVKSKIQEYLLKDNFINEQSFREYISYFPSPFPEKSLATTHPDLNQMWHKKNAPLELTNFSAGSRHKVWWQCLRNEEHVWEAQISSVSRGHRCPICAGQKVGVNNSLQVRFPELITEWHSKKNGNLNPSDFTWGSGVKVWWKCPEGDDHEWEAAIRHRTSNGSGCPFCSGNRISKDNNLGVNFPNLAREWHPTKNGTLTPHDVMPYTVKKVWWICPENHDWQVSVAKRTARGQSCTVCFSLKK